MDPAGRLRRHAQLWDTTAANARRIAVGGVIFAVLILLNVIEPHFRVEQQKEKLPEWQTELATLKDRQQELEKRKNSLQSLSQELRQIAADIERAPWQTDIQALIKTCARGCPRNVQEIANQTISDIAQKMRDISIVPLRTKVEASSMQAELGDSIKNMEAAIDSWEQGRQNKVWYGTIASKEATAAAVGSNVRAETRNAESAVSALNTSTSEELAGIGEVLKTTQDQLANSQQEVADQIKEQEQKINDAMLAALPGWASGLFTVKTMVVLYPWILVVMGFAVVGYGLLAGHHYRGMAAAEGWSVQERSDPLLSSPWTLTFRGAAGSVITLLLYGAVLAFFSYCLYRSTRAASMKDIPPPSEQVFSLGLPTELAVSLLAIALILAAVTVGRSRT